MLSPITMILRGYNYEEVKCVAEVLLESKYVRNMEVTLNSDNAIDIIRKISKEYGSVLNVGAGTVQTIVELKLSVEAGASFILSPRMMTEEMINYCKEKSVLSVPGSFTASEIGASFDQGADVVKVFPANELTTSYAKSICAPMGNLKLMAVGGVNKLNVYDYLSSGYEYVGTAGGLFSKEDIKNNNKENMKKSLFEFENEVAKHYEEADKE